MLVSAIEALGVPNVSGWDQRRAVARFIKFVQQAAPGPLDEIMTHGNFKEAFGNRTSRTRFLKDLYSRRSRPLHTGFMQHNVQGALGYFANTPVQMRVAFTSELVRACIKSFMEVPFSSLIGHPGHRAERGRLGVPGRGRTFHKPKVQGPASDGPKDAAAPRSRLANNGVATEDRPHPALKVEPTASLDAGHPHRLCH
jgi:hypothetical protein